MKGPIMALGAARLVGDAARVIINGGALELQPEHVVEAPARGGAGH